MQVKQIQDLVNDITREKLGEEALLTDDLSNVVDVGDTIANRMGVENFARVLPDHIGRMIISNREYDEADGPDIYMDGWEWGSIMEKIKTNSLPVAEEDEMWELEDGTSYDPNIFTKPDVSAKFYNKYDAFKITYPSVATSRLKSAFDSPSQLNAFMSMIHNNVSNSLKVKLKGLKLATISNMIGETIYNEYSSGVYSGSSGIRAINLLYEYNLSSGESLTAATAVTDPDFIRYACYRMGLVEKRMRDMSTLFNVNGYPKFTSRDKLNAVLLAEFSSAATVFLQSDTFHKELVALPKAREVSYWQGSGTSYGFSDTSKVKITTTGNHTITAGGILGCIYDREALGVTCIDQKVTSQYNGAVDITNSWMHYKAGYFNDFDENFVVFFVA